MREALSEEEAQKTARPSTRQLAEVEKWMKRFAHWTLLVGPACGLPVRQLDEDAPFDTDLYLGPARTGRSCCFLFFAILYEELR